ncbi:MAG: InlB B-repeat-containing protein [Clostridia bacterium]|nr:InlB B-repeat-containing protein [Clostridia bacterium]
MKAIKKFLVGLLSVCMLVTLSVGLVACGGKDEKPTNSGLTVTFMVEGAQYGQVQTVQKGRRITKPQDPTFSVEGYVFTGWFTTESFDEGTMWNFTTGIVNENLTLYAGYRVVNAHVTGVAKANEAVTSKLVWTQSAASNAEDYEVKLTDKAGNTIDVLGTVEYDSANYQVTFTPSVIPQGGKYTVSVKDKTKTQPACVVENVLFGGAGTQTNPYLVGSSLDFTAINKANVAQNTYFSLVSNITIEAVRSEQTGFEFNGIFNGNGRTITLENSNSGAIYKVGATGQVYNVSVAGKISTSSYDSIGTIVDYNGGKVEKVRSTANVENTGGTAGSNGLANALNVSLEDGKGSRGIAGGIVGTNLAGATVYNCTVTTSSSSTGTIKASIAGGVIVGLNYGKIEMCTGNGCLGAWNAKETGKSLSNYSYGGAIVGINAGQVLKCAVNGSGKVLAQRFTNETDATNSAGTNNSNIGGIAGYNLAGASISECYFSGVRVHGDENVGGIAGLNAGAITDCYVEGIVQSTNILTYIGGRTNVGGIVGKTESTGTVENCYSTANVYAYGTNNAVAYALAEKANNSIYVSANPNSESSDDGKDNPTPAALTAPTGTGNAILTVEGGSFDGTTNNMVVAEANLATINGNSKFYFNSTTVKLNFEKDVLPEETVAVVLYNADGSKFDDATVAETGMAISGPVVKGYKFVGWAVEMGGEIVFAAGATISLYDLLDYEEKALYAVLEERLPNEGLIVAVWSRYIDETNSAAIEQAFEAYIAGLDKTYDVEFRAYAENKVADFCAAVNKDGDIDVIIGAGSTVNSSNGIDWIARTNMITTGYTDRLAALLTDTDRAIEFFGWITGRGTATAEITFSVNGETTSATVSELLGDSVSAPSVTAEEGFEFIGWANSATATEAQVTATKVDYALVKDILSEGKVTLYPVFSEIAQEEPEEPAVDTAIKISVWTKGGDWVTAGELTAIKNGFTAYLTSQGIDVTTLTITYVETSTSGVADLGVEVNTAGDFDFIIGCGANVTTKGLVQTEEKMAVSASVLSQGSRYVARLTDNTLAVHLYAYFTSINA